MEKTELKINEVIIEVLWAAIGVSFYERTWAGRAGGKEGVIEHDTPTVFSVERILV